jgi:tRNA pseudouridine32 synthase/23S rRNA pseudouridine746 synthase
MHHIPTCFNHFTVPVKHISKPDKFTYPFYYEPHPLALQAANELQRYLSEQQEWQHNFGIADSSDSAIGKMFGVLVVQTQSGEFGYLAAFSGKLADSNHWSHFVPPVFDMLDESSFFLERQTTINELSRVIEQLELSDGKRRAYEKTLADEQLQADAEISAHRQVMIEGRKQRKQRRKSAESELSLEAYHLLCEQLASESIAHKKQLAFLQTHWQERINAVQQGLDALLRPINALKEQRKRQSFELQQALFEQYQFTSLSGEQKSIHDLFGDSPPAGTGECAAPKLLNYAFNHQLSPIALAEFWWGASPKSEVRQHGQFYPACQAKCKPILTHMLAGLEVEPNPLISNPGSTKQIEIVYQDDALVIINKPAELLSVPGKTISDSVFTRMKSTYPDATGPLIVHRLDMSTSGLMVIALTKDANKHLQAQFISRSVDKRYVALLDGELQATQGTIILPLRVDLDDRPRQVVCYEYGKHAETDWTCIEVGSGKSRVYFYPKTGRTHQLRMHSAHHLGLNMPIIGDDLYGNKAQRLHLHADLLSLTHPVSNERMTFQIDPDF